MPAGPAQPSRRGGGAFRIIFLVGLLAIVTIGGIAVGRSLEPGGSSAVASTSTTVTTVPHPRKPRVRSLVWGPLAALPFGTLPDGSALAGAAIEGPTLVVAGGSSSRNVLAGPIGGKLAPVATLPKPLAAAEVFGRSGSVYVLGGEHGSAVADQIYRIDLSSGKAVRAGTFEEPLAESGVASRGSSVYFAGGWTGTQYATAILKFAPPGTSKLIARLPDGLRGPAVALLGQTLYVAGGRTETGLSKKVYAVDLDTGKVSIFGTLPQGVEQSILVVSAEGIFMLGGETAAGKAVDTVVRIDPITGYATDVGKLTTPFTGAADVPAGQRTIVVVAPAGTVYRVS
jgi:hypothetical protein